MYSICVCEVAFFDSVWFRTPEIGWWGLGQLGSMYDCVPSNSSCPRNVPSSFPFSASLSLSKVQQSNFE